MELKAAALRRQMAHTILISLLPLCPSIVAELQNTKHQINFYIITQDKAAWSWGAAAGIIVDIYNTVPLQPSSAMMMSTDRYHLQITLIKSDLNKSCFEIIFYFSFILA